MQAKLLRTILFSFTVGVVVAGSILFVVIDNIYHANMIKNLDITGAVIAEKLSNSLAFSDVKIAGKSLAFSVNNQNIDLICLYNSEGVLFSEYTKSKNGTQCEGVASPITDELSVEKQNVLSLSIPIFEARPGVQGAPNTENKKTLGHIYIRANTSIISETQRTFILLLPLALFVSLFVAVILAKFLMIRSLVPLDTLYKLSIIIAKDPLSEERVEKKHNNELGEVIDVFNSMLDNLARENKELFLSENRFRKLAENAPIGVFLKTELGGYQYINTHWSLVTSLDSDSTHLFLSFINEADREHYKQTMALALYRKQAQNVEYRYTCPNRGERILIEYISPVADSVHGQCFVGSLLDMTELKSAQAKMEKLAYYDALTNLSNRTFFRDNLETLISAARKENTCVAMYMTNIDEFKKVNDSLGHDIGDRLLIEIAQRLQKTLKDCDVVSRMGGDEFVVLSRDTQLPGQLKETAERVFRALQAQINNGNDCIQVTGSVGVSIFPVDTKTPEELIRYAGMALYDSKKTGGNEITYYSKELGQKVRDKVRIEQKLRQALIDNKLDVFIQPQYLADSRKVYWGEALVRWHDDEDGYISPSIFIPMAEDTGLIYDIEDFVLDSVLTLLAEELEKLKKLGIQGVSVNLSAKQFFAPNFSKRIREKFQTYKVDPKLVEFELTETTVMDDIDKAIVVMESMRELGCHLSIDDFGTGYSSLTYLKRFPITSLKIDKSFIKDIPSDQNDVEISCAIIAMAHSLGLSVVAEGVETEMQAKLLASYSCEFLQGYYFDEPLSIAQLLARADYPQSVPLEVTA